MVFDNHGYLSLQMQAFLCFIQNPASCGCGAVGHVQFVKAVRADIPQGSKRIMFQDSGASRNSLSSDLTACDCGATVSG